MKRRIFALKLSILGLTIGLFIFGWALVARLEADDLEALRQTSTPPSNENTSSLTMLPDLPPIPTLPPIRTRVS